MALVQILELLAIAAALLAAWYWYRAGDRPPRRISGDEELDAADLNRIVVALHRAAILNRRAALASAASASMIALSMITSWAL
ncbi:hypothetical protein T8K17_14520 [Thalassobaculum sp. OXR-137]|uniref:hypothetical protein n=1 Tax=Thalassobaculum sp. OXR-137 TaxID=3100173 RepID=UPI002AC9449E|nr:hypothetical protein [Thalassobaculum sp. OXR-137]WPZ32455.1 hypothetical protein T8K17_14520 [Thalassobaculum sp. OXR-137]